jgi:hypothetical protein
MTAGTRKRKSGEGSSKRRGKRSVVVPEKKYEFESHSKLDNLYRCYQFLACARTEELEGLQTHMEMYSKVFFGDMASQVGQGLCADEQRRALLVNTLERFPVFELFERNNPDFVIYRYEPELCDHLQIENHADLRQDADRKNHISFGKRVMKGHSRGGIPFPGERSARRQRATA